MLQTVEDPVTLEKADQGEEMAFYGLDSVYMHCVFAHTYKRVCANTWYMHTHTTPTLPHIDMDFLCSYVDSLSLVSRLLVNVSRTDLGSDFIILHEDNLSFLLSA